MGEISIIGLDLAKQVFQVHGADKAGRYLLRKQLKRRATKPGSFRRPMSSPM